MERIARAGFEYVEPQATAPFCPHIDPWRDDPGKFKQRVKNLGFKGVSGLWAPHGAIMADDQCVEGISQAIRWAREAGIPAVFAGDGVKPGNLSDEDALKVLRDRLGQILVTAGECGVYLAIEPHGTFSLTAAGLKKIMAMSDSKWLGINYDTANVARAAYVETKGGSYSWASNQTDDEKEASANEVATLEAVIDRVVHVHAKDVKGENCVILGQGTVDVGGCLRALHRRDYKGVLSVETEGNFSLEEGSRLIGGSRDYLGRMLASFR